MSGMLRLGAVRRAAESVIEFFHDWVGRESGVPAEMTFGQLWTYRDGRFVRMVMYCDVDEARLGARGE